MLGISFLVFFVGLILALPMCVSMGLACYMPNLINSSFMADASYIATAIVGGLNTTPILAVPLFMLSGILMTKGQIAKRLFDVFSLIAGTKTAGLPCAVIITCLFYGAISGSGPATAAAVGAMTIPILVELGYDKVWAGTLVATAGGLGVIIPPSIPFIMYGLMTGVSVGDMFIGGIIPGCLIALCLCLCAVLYCKKNGEDREKITANYQKLKDKGAIHVLRESFWALLTPVIILGSIYGGFCTPTDAAAISVFYALIVTLFVYRTIRVKDIPKLLCEAVAAYAPIAILIAIATAFMRVLVFLKAANMIQELIMSMNLNRVTFLLILNLILLFIGMVMECGSAVTILSPLLLPVAEALGINGVHLGMVMIVNMAIGFVTPPFGLNLFVTAPMIKAPVIELGKKAMPMIGFFMIALLLITFVPWFTMALIS